MTDSSSVPAENVANDTVPSGPATVATSAALDDERRHEIGADLAHTVLAEASRRLVAAVADYEAGLDQRVTLSELQFLDHEMELARRTLDVADRAHTTAGCAHPDHGGAVPGADQRTGC